MGCVTLTTHCIQILQRLNWHILNTFLYSSNSKFLLSFCSFYFYTSWHLKRKYLYILAKLFAVEVAALSSCQAGFQCLMIKVQNCIWLDVTACHLLSFPFQSTMPMILCTWFSKKYNNSPMLFLLLIKSDHSVMTWPELRTKLQFSSSQWQFSLNTNRICYFAFLSIS